MSANKHTDQSKHRSCTPCFKADRKREKDEADNENIVANVAEEVRTKRQRKTKKKRAQETTKRCDGASTHEVKLIEVRETELSAQGGKSVKTESALQLVTTSNSNSANRRNTHVLFNLERSHDSIFIENREVVL